MSSDEFGGMSDDDLLAAELGNCDPLQEELITGRPHKRRRTNYDDGHASFDEREDETGTKPIQEGNKTPEKPQQKPTSKYKIHIPKQTEVFEDEFYTQLPQASQSPYRLRGARWLKQPRPPLPSIQPEQVLPRRGTEDEIGPGLEDEDNISNSSLLQRSRAAQEEAAVEQDRLIDELANLPSDAFSAPGTSFQPIEVSSQDPNQFAFGSQLTRPQRLPGTQTNLRQTTLFGGKAPPESQLPIQSQAARQHNWPLTSREEPPTHHKLEHEALQSWVYPTNLGAIREYQYSIVARGLYHNVLVALPTGLGKTFIAATIMLNWFRWTKDAQIVFVAPTKPLVAQQVEACFGIVGIPRSETAMLTGGTPPGIRAEEWLSKRVFFMTPQTIVNDLKTGICDPKRIVLLVVDEAHRATGNYAYVEVVRFLRRFNNSFRVLALTATPGATVESVQEVIDGLEISRVEIRTEASMDIRQYVHSRKVEKVTFDYSEEMVLVMELFAKALQPILNKLNAMNAYWLRDPVALTPFGLRLARQQWMASQPGRNANMGVKGMVNTIFALLAGLAHSMDLLKYHGIAPFFHKIKAFQTETESGDKGGKYRKEIVSNKDFKAMMNHVQGWIGTPEFVGHPKLDYLQGVVLNHFLDAGDGRNASAGISPASTRIMVFVQFRDSAEEVARVLGRNAPMIRPHVFVGQANSAGSDGMDQKTQQEVIEKFKSGIYNTLIATSIGEEGLDIGEVDRIVCYDSSASPIRMLQRMGRTGRKRAGNIVILLMNGKEADNYEKAKDNYEQIQKLISDGSKFVFHDDKSPRIVPKGIQPIVEKRIIEIPPENTQPELPEPRKRGRIPKRPPKKFHMPDGVRTGFTKASKIDDGEDEESDAAEKRISQMQSRARSASPEPIPPISSVVLTAFERKDLERTYQDIGGDIPEFIEAPKLDRFPKLQRSLRHAKDTGHGKVTKRVVKMLRMLSEVTETSVRRFEDNLIEKDRLAGDIQAKKRADLLHGNFDTLQVSDEPSRHSSTPKFSRQAKQPGKQRPAPDCGSDLTVESGYSVLEQRIGSSSTSHEDVIRTDDEDEEEREENDDLDDSSANGLYGEQPLASSITSMLAINSPALDAFEKPFYEPSKTAYASESQLDGELSDLEMFGMEKAWAKPSVPLKDQSADELSQLTQRKGKRKLVVDSDSDE